MNDANETGIPGAVSDYMRGLQKKSAEARWSGVSERAKKNRMAALAKARWGKKKAAAKGKNGTAEGAENAERGSGLTRRREGTKES